MSFAAINYVPASADIRAAHEISFIIAFRVQSSFARTVFSECFSNIQSLKTDKECGEVIFYIYIFFLRCSFFVFNPCTYKRRGKSSDESSCKYELKNASEFFAEGDNDVFCTVSSFESPRIDKMYVR